MQKMALDLDLDLGLGESNKYGSLRLEDGI